MDLEIVQNFVKCTIVKDVEYFIIYTLDRILLIKQSGSDDTEKYENVTEINTPNTEKIRQI